MQLGPCLNKSPLFLRERSGNQIHRADGEDCCLVLEIRVEMGKVVGRAGLGEHPDYDSEEAAQFRHETMVASGWYFVPARALWHGVPWSGSMNFLDALAPVGHDRTLALAIDPERIPAHIAIIMDGNGRWAKSRGLPRFAGHRAGVTRVRSVVEDCSHLACRH